MLTAEPPIRDILRTRPPDPAVFIDRLEEADCPRCRAAARDLCEAHAELVIELL